MVKRSPHGKEQSWERAIRKKKRKEKRKRIAKKLNKKGLPIMKKLKDKKKRYSFRR